MSQDLLREGLRQVVFGFRKATGVSSEVLVIVKVVGVGALAVYGFPLDFVANSSEVGPLVGFQVYSHVVATRGWCASYVLRR